MTSGTHQTLGQYFKELRTSARRFPLLDRAAVEAIGDKLGSEMARRFWGMPTGTRRGGKSSREAWGAHFLRQQAAQRSPMLKDVAERAKMDTAAVWKIEHDKGVRGDTVRRALVDGLSFAPDSAEVRRALALLTARSGAGEVAVTALQTEIADVEARQTFNQFLERAVAVLATIPAGEYNAVLEALSNPAVIESFASLNKLAAAGKALRLRVVPKRKQVEVCWSAMV